MEITELRDFIEVVPDAVIVTDGAGRVVEVNQQAMTMTGYGRDELAGLGLDALVPELVQTAHPALRDRFMAGPHVRPMGPVGNLMLRRKDGRDVPVDIRLGFLGDAGGRLTIAAIRDMTAEREAQRRLQESEQRFRSLTELSSDWYWEQDENYRLSFISDYYTAKTGMKMQAVLGRTRWEIDHIWEYPTSSCASTRRHWRRASPLQTCM